MADPEDFIQALVALQNDNSPQLLDTELNRLPRQACMPDKDKILDEVIREIWEHPCPSCIILRKKIEAKAKEILKWELIIPNDSSYKVLTDTTQENIRW
jgi:hypothetical protein